MIRIREFKQGDEAKIRQIFQSGIRHQFKTGILDHVFWLPPYIVLFLAFVLFYFVFKLHVVCVFLFYFEVLAALAWYMNRGLNNYINHSLQDDLYNIGKYYNGIDACMWVAVDESNQVVGHIALDANAWRRAQESKESNSIDYDHYVQRIVELRRCSVEQKCRNRGVGKLLVNHFLEKAREKFNAKSVFLTTTTLQRPAIKLYSNYRFKKVGYVQRILPNTQIIKMQINM